MVEEKTIYTFDQPLTRYQFSDINLTIVSGYPPMSEDEPTPEPTPTPPEPEPSDPTVISISWVQSNEIQTNTINLPLTFDSQNKDAHCIGYSTDTTYNLIWGADYTFPLTYYSSYQMPSGTAVHTTVSDFYFPHFMCYNISCSYLSTDSAFSSGTDNLQTLQIEGYKNTDSSAIVDTNSYSSFTWESTKNVQYNYFIYDKTDDIFYYTHTDNNVGLNENHEQYFINLPTAYNFTHFKTRNGFFWIDVAGHDNDATMGIIKITHASKYLPSVTTL